MKLPALEQRRREWTQISMRKEYAVENQLEEPKLMVSTYFSRLTRCGRSSGMKVCKDIHGNAITLVVSYRWIWFLYDKYSSNCVYRSLWLFYTGYIWLWYIYRDNMRQPVMALHHFFENFGPALSSELSEFSTLGEFCGSVPGQRKTVGRWTHILTILGAYGDTLTICCLFFE